MKQGTIELVLFALIFLSLQFWWISMTIKKGRTGEVDKWGQKTSSKQENELEKAKQELEKLFRSQFFISKYFEFINYQNPLESYSAGEDISEDHLPLLELEIDT